MLKSLVLAAALGLAATSLSSGARAQEAAPDYAGKTFDVLIPNPTGGGTDIFSRLVARYMSKHLPGEPTLVVRNVPGGSGLKMLQYFKQIDEASDPTFIVSHSSLPFRARSGKIDQADFDPRKMHWIGSGIASTNVCILSSSVDSSSLEALRKRELKMGTMSRGSQPESVYKMLASALGLNIKVVVGYENTPAVALAVARGEIDGMCSALSSYTAGYKSIVTDGKAKLFLYMGPVQRTDMGDAPYFFDMDMTADKRDFFRRTLSSISLGLPIALGPETDPAVVAAAREAFDATFQDPEFLKEAAVIGVDVRYTSGEDVTKAVADLYSTPDAEIAEMAEFLAGE